MSQMIRVGRITKVHGIKGEMKLELFHPDQDQISQADHIYIEDEETPYTVQSYRQQNQRFIVKLEGIQTIEQAEKFSGKYIFIKRESLRQLEEDEYLISDMIGYQVLLGTGEIIGELVDVLDYTQHDILVIQTNEKQVMIPFIKQFVTEVSTKQRKIMIEPIEGMLS